MENQKETGITDAYSLFVYAIRTQITRDYYLRRLRTFFDFIELLPNSRIENRCNRFSAIAIKDHNWTFSKISPIDCVVIRSIQGSLGFFNIM
ncbi:MAG TPA: hypothetical protein VFY55_00275 [Nitrososphaeraceae archaeon]|nr:hypothetical protein [Nitrososphaeraceae archaeon]